MLIVSSAIMDRGKCVRQFERLTIYVIININVFIIQIIKDHIKHIIFLSSSILKFTQA